MGEQEKLEACIAAIDRAIAEGTVLDNGHAQEYAVSTVVAALRVVTLSFETLYISAMNDRIAAAHRGAKG